MQRPVSRSRRTTASSFLARPQKPCPEDADMDMLHFRSARSGLTSTSTRALADSLMFGGFSKLMICRHWVLMVTLSSAKCFVRTIPIGMCLDDSVTTCIEAHGPAGLLLDHGATQMPYERASGERPSSWWRGQGRKPAATKEAPASGGHHRPRRRE